ncbi:MAG: replicative DNA helicase [Zhenhengia sp.]|uniref:replicative DNA helicase n=1 Tax=Zhenhengia sp. TaxID=2944208 RepID=UPI00291277FD|nr:replicative DNA helicase [Clostridiales bacterium]MDU6974486.1 replicative DNA helicase [Clostridiales bacterium]
MHIDMGGVLDHFGERMKRLAIYDPLYRLGRKTKKDHSSQDIPYYELGMLTLLFFFENMIVRQKTSGVKELAAFLYKVNDGKIDMNREEFLELAREIIDVFRPSNGSRNSMTFYNWETKQEETIYYSILKAARADVKSNTQYYTLDDQGLELIFSSKEYFSEFQISINQLLLRKQLEKGEFIGALRQVDEMSLSVENLRERLMKIKHEVTRSIVSEETYERYKNLIEDIHIRLARENQEFDELQDFVRLTKDSLKYQIENEKDKKAYTLMLKIDQQLEAVHHEHSKLLQDSIVLRTHALEAAQQALYFIGLDNFNFQQDIVGAMMGKPLPLHASKTFVEPFLQVARSREWYPLSVFGKQRIEKRTEEETGRAFLEGASEEQLNQHKEQLKAYFKEVMLEARELLKGRTCISLEEICSSLEEKESVLLEQRLFYDFWIMLHQKSPIDLDELDDESLLSGVKEVLRGMTNSIKVRENEGEIEKYERFTITNMEIDLTLEVKAGEDDGI